MLMGWIYSAIVITWAIGFSLTFRKLWRREVLATDDAYVKCYRKRARDAYNHYRWEDKTKLPGEEWVNKNVDCTHPGKHTENGTKAVWGAIFWPLYWGYTMWWNVFISKKPIRSAALTELHTELRLARQAAEAEAQLAVGEQLLAAIKKKEDKAAQQQIDETYGRRMLASSKPPRLQSPLDALPADSPLRPALEEMLATMELVQRQAPGAMFSWDLEVSTGLSAPVRKHVPVTPIKVTDQRHPELAKYHQFGSPENEELEVTYFNG